MTSPAPTTRRAVRLARRLDDDDRPIGRILSRREVLALIGASGTAAFLAACTPGGGASRHPPAAAGSSGASASASASAAATAGSSAAVGERAARVRRRAGADRGPVLRRRRARALRHPDEHVRWRRGRRRAADASSGCLPGRRLRVHADGRRHRRRVALRRARRVLRRPGQQRRLPARLPAHRRHGQGDVHDDLPRLVPGPRGPHPLQDPDRPRRGAPASSSRRSCSSTTTSAGRSTRAACTPRRARRTCRTSRTGSTTRAAARRCSR